MKPLALTIILLFTLAACNKSIRDDGEPVEVHAAGQSMVLLAETIDGSVCITIKSFRTPIRIFDNDVFFLDSNNNRIGQPDGLECIDESNNTISEKSVEIRVGKVVTIVLRRIPKKTASVLVEKYGIEYFKVNLQSVR